MSPEIASLWPVRSKKWSNNLPTQRYLNPLPLIILSPLLILPTDGAGFTWWLVIRACNTTCWHVEKYSIDTSSFRDISMGNIYWAMLEFFLRFFFGLKKALQNFRTSILTITNPTLKPAHVVSHPGLCCSWSAVSIGTLIHFRKGSRSLYWKSFYQTHLPAFHLQLLQGQLLLTLSHWNQLVNKEDALNFLHQWCEWCEGPSWFTLKDWDLSCAIHPQPWAGGSGSLPHLCKEPRKLQGWSTAGRSSHGSSSQLCEQFRAARWVPELTRDHRFSRPTHFSSVA